MDRQIAEQLYDPRKMSVKSQIAFISKQLLKKGIDPDTVDLQALIDPTLNYRENYASIMASLAGSAKVGPKIKNVINNPACEKAKELKQEISEHQEKDAKLQDLKADLKDANTACKCNTCSQMGLYDPGDIPPRWFKAMYRAIRKRSNVKNPGTLVRSIWDRLSHEKKSEIKRKEAKGEKWDREDLIRIYDPAPRRRPARGQQRLSGPKQKTLPISRPPKHWFYAMVEGIRKRSDVRNAEAIVASIWRRLSPSKRAEIKRRELKGERFKYDLPLPRDYPTRGTGTMRTVKPFNLGEVQINVSGKDFIDLNKSGLFQRMRRNDGSTALVKRCKSNSGNCNIFIDRT